MCRVQKGKELNDFQRNLLDVEILSNLRFGSLEIRDTSVTRVTSILRKPAHLPKQVLIRPNVSVLERILNRKVCIHLAARVDEFPCRWFRRKGCQGKRITSDSVARHRLYSTQQSLTQSMRLYSGSKTQHYINISLSVKRITPEILGLPKFICVCTKNELNEINAYSNVYPSQREVKFT